MAPPPPWLQPCLTMTAIFVAIFREEILAYKTAAKEGVKASKVRRLNYRLTLITELHSGSTEALAEYVRHWLVYPVVLALVPFYPTVEQVPDGYKAHAMLMDTLLTCVLFFTGIFILNAVADVADYKKFRAKTEAKILKLGGTVEVPEKPKRKRKAAANPAR
jgi:hypothetical protein